MSPRVPLFMILFISATPSAVATHPGHYSTSEIEWNSSTQRFEVAMCLRISDFEDALSLQQEQRVSLEATPNVGHVVRSYLQQHFSIASGDSRSCRLHWVGMELELHDVWIYFEADAAKQVGTVGVHTPEPSRRETHSVPTWGELLRGADHRNSGPPPAVHIRNSVISDVQPEQTNFVTLKYESKRTTISLSKEKFYATIPAGIKPLP